MLKPVVAILPPAARFVTSLVSRLAAGVGVLVAVLAFLHPDPERPVAVRAAGASQVILQGLHQLEILAGEQSEVLKTGDPIECSGTDPQGRYLAVGHFGRIERYELSDPSRPALSWSLPGAKPLAVAATSQGDLLAGTRTEIRRYAARNGEQTTIVLQAGLDLGDLICAADGVSFVTVEQSREHRTAHIRLRDLATLELRRELWSCVAPYTIRLLADAQSQRITTERGDKFAYFPKRGAVPEVQQLKTDGGFGSRILCLDSSWAAFVGESAPRGEEEFVAFHRTQENWQFRQQLGFFSVGAWSCGDREWVCVQPRGGLTRVSPHGLTPIRPDEAALDRSLFWGAIAAGCVAAWAAFCAVATVVRSVGAVAAQQPLHAVSDGVSALQLGLASAFMFYMSFVVRGPGGAIGLVLWPAVWIFAILFSFAMESRRGLIWLLLSLPGPAATAYAGWRLLVAFVAAC